MKKILALILTILGGGGLIFGVITLFMGNLAQSSTWIAIILGGIFFAAGIALFKSTETEKVTVQSSDSSDS